MDGIDDLGRFVGLWFSFGLAVGVGLSAILDVALINEPFGWTLYAGNLAALAVAFLVYRRFPDLRTGTVWRFAATTFLVFAALATLNGTLDARTNGALHPVLVAVLTWVAALAIGYVVGTTSDWRTVLRRP
jgi:hypothetical protein